MVLERLEGLSQLRVSEAIKQKTYCLERRGKRLCGD